MSVFALLFGPDGWGPLLLKGTAVTLGLALATLPVGFGLGLAIALLKRSKLRVVRAAAEAYTTLFRGIPDLLALFIVYFGLQAAVNRLGGLLALDVHIEVNAFLAGVVALGAIAAAYSSEVWVAGMAAVPGSQGEAAASVGLSRAQTFGLVILPQVVRVALPGLGNVWTILLKDTSLISVLAVMDLMRAASEASRATREPILFFSVSALVYLAISVVSNLAQVRLERRTARGHA